MSKTNFKCMFLIDDKLYNKAILQEGPNDNTKNKVPIHNSTYLTPIPSSHQLTTVNPISNMASSARLNLSSEFKETNDLAKVDNGQQVKIDLSDKDQQTDVPFGSASSTDISLPNKSGNNDDMEAEQSRNEKEDCECYETPPKASSSQKRQTGDVETNSKQPQKRLTTQRPLSAKAKRKLSDDDDNLSDDSDWEELKHRYKRLRGDFDSPPREQNNSKNVSEGVKAVSKISSHVKRKSKQINKRLTTQKKKKLNFDHVSEREKSETRSNENETSTLADKRKDNLITKFESISYICSICKEIFQKRNALHRHIMNWHSEYFKKPDRNDVKKKRNMSQNQTRQKIRRTEFPCKLCQRFFKTTSALERHNLSIHGVNRGSKRANDENAARYVKRQKVNSKPAVTYLNYF